MGARNRFRLPQLSYETRLGDSTLNNSENMSERPDLMTRIGVGAFVAAGPIMAMLGGAERRMGDYGGAASRLRPWICRWDTDWHPAVRGNVF
jgi:hypothetical protein